MSAPRGSKRTRLVARLLAIILGSSALPLTFAAEAPPGQAAYQAHCAACHGKDGDGNGPATVWLYPRPRNFNLGLFKIQSTPAGSLPSDEDLFQVITRGMPGSSMPAFNYLPEAERRELVRHVKWLTASVKDGQRANKFEEAVKSGAQKPPIAVPPEPGVTVEALVRGKELYTKLQCANCHGETGVGDGPAAAEQKDSLGLPLPPRDFTIGAFRGGSTGRDLYFRVANGMASTPMLAFTDEVLPPTDRWAVVQYVQSLRRSDAQVNDLLRPTDTTLRAQRVRKLPVAPTDPAWEKLDSVRVPLNPLWPEPYPIPAVAVTAVHDGQKLSVLMQWRDDIANGAPVRVEDFQDAIALQWSLKGTTPFLGMGDTENPVNLWMWKAGWQQAIAGARPDVDTVNPALHVDTYFATSYRTAEATGNLQAVLRPPTAVEDANARGFGSFAPQPAAGQNVHGQGVWRGGFWSVVVTRDLRSRDKDDVQFAAGKSVPVAFAVWNGEQRDRNGRKVVSNWHHLVLDR